MGRHPGHPDGGPGLLNRAGVQVGPYPVVGAGEVGRAAQQLVDHVQALVEHRGPHPWVRLLPQVGEVPVRRLAQADPEDGASCAELVQRGHLLGHGVGAAAGQWRHHRAQPHPFGHGGQRAQHHPRVQGRDARAPLHVVPEEDAVPPRGLSLATPGEDPSGVGERWQADGVLHGPTVAAGQDTQPCRMSRTRGSAVGAGGGADHALTLVVEARGLDV